MEVSRSADLTEIVSEDQTYGVFLVLRSPDSAEDAPDYRILAEFPTRTEAERFLKIRNPPVG
jgi:hypothetical protein